MTDYRVRAHVSFDLDVPAMDADNAGVVARKIIREVFRLDFSRAECLFIDARYGSRIAQDEPEYPL